MAKKKVLLDYQNCLEFSFENSKEKESARILGIPLCEYVVLDLLAIVTCTFADKCLKYCFSDKNQKFRKLAYNMRKRNTDNIRACSTDISKMVELIENSLKKFPNIRVIRIHSSGDFFSMYYYKAWKIIAFSHPEIIFYGYSKNLLAIVDCTESDINNFKLVYSYGGKLDKIRDKKYSSIPTAYVRTELNQYENIPTVCREKGMEEQDFRMILRQKSFVLNLH